MYTRGFPYATSLTLSIVPSLDLRLSPIRSDLSRSLSLWSMCFSVWGIYIYLWELHRRVLYCVHILSYIYIYIIISLSIYIYTCIYNMVYVYVYIYIYIRFYIFVCL